MDKSCFYILILNALAYLVLFVSYQRRKRAFDLGSVLTLAWLVGSLGSVYYYTFEVTYLSYTEIEFIPIAFLFCINLMLFSPFLKTDYSTIRKVEVYNLRKVLIGIAWIFSFIAIPPFFNAILSAKDVSLMGNALGEMYNVDEDKTLLIFNPAIRPFYSILRHFTAFVVFLFFYYLTLSKRNQFVFLGLFLCVCNYFLVAILSASRGGVVSLIIQCVFFAMLMRHMYSKKLLALLKKIAIVGGICLAFGIGFISLSRVADMSETSGRDILIDQWIAQYAGEGIIRYSHTVWRADGTMEGMQNLPLIYSLVDSGVKDLDYVSNIGQNIFHFPITVFYTYVGDFILDFGIAGSLAFALTIFLATRFLIRIRKGRISIYHCIFLSYIFTMLTMGFTANVFRTYYTQLPMVEVGLLLAVLYILQCIHRYKSRLEARHPDSQLH